jgi:hypothetical protein
MEMAVGISHFFAAQEKSAVMGRAGGQGVLMTVFSDAK